MSTLADTAVTGLAPERASEAAELLLARLGIPAIEAERLQSIPADQIVAALTGGGVAGGQAGQSGPAQDISLRYVPVVDGTTLPAHPFEPASALSADIPILTGSNECEGIPYGNPDDRYWTSEPTSDAELRDRVTQMLRIADADAARVIALYRAGRPGIQPATSLPLSRATPRSCGRPRTRLPRGSSAQRRAPVYLYSFNWRSPVRGGKLRCMHCMELPFVFDHPDLIQFMTGTGRDRYELAKNMSEAWVAFARTGDPNHSGIPRWDPWNPERWPTMVFNTETRAVNDPWGDERRRWRACKNEETLRLVPADVDVIRHAAILGTTTSLRTSGGKIMATTTETALQVKTISPSLTVNDLQKSIRFFEGLGFAVDEKWEDKGVLIGVMLRAGQAEIGLSQDDWQKGRDRQKGVGMRISLGTAQNIDQLAKRAKDAGVTLDSEVHDTEWGAGPSRSPNPADSS